MAALGLWAFALARGGCYYVLGVLARGRPGGRLESWAERRWPGSVEQAESEVRRLGPRAIILSYPLYGVSAGSQIVSGGLRMRLTPFYLALGVVSLPWAIMQAVIGVAAIQSFLLGYAPGITGIVVLLLVIVVLRARWRRRRTERGAAP